MSHENYISIQQLSLYYKVELSFFSHLHDTGLIEIITIEQTPYLHLDTISDIEKILRLHDELNLSIEGIDIVINLLQKIDALQNELNAVKNRLRLYEG
jgi:hypothetical protein